MVQKLDERRGRPRSFDADTAIAQALDVFWELGYAGTTLDAITEATGLNRPSLYNAFGNKHAIYRKALDRYSATYRDAMIAALAYDRPLREAMKHAFDAATAIYVSGKKRPRGCFLLATALTEALLDREIKTAMAEGLRQLEKMFQARIRFARDHGDLAQDTDPGI